MLQTAAAAAATTADNCQLRVRLPVSIGTVILYFISWTALVCCEQDESHSVRYFFICFSLIYLSVMYAVV